jgi:peptide chain release factor 1
MFDKLAEMERRFEEVERQLSDASVASDQNRLRDLGREHSELAPVVQAYREHRTVSGDLLAAREMLKDSSGPDASFLRDEIAGFEDRTAKLEHELREMLVPKDPTDERDVIVEIRSAAGGDEAALFARDLYEMYGRYAEQHRWKLEPLSTSPSDLGGFKDVTFAVKGKGAYSRLKYESGVHRVQRVPTTESQGRIHTSTATVAVLPEAQDVDVQINPNELKIQRALRPVGQYHRLGGPDHASPDGRGRRLPGGALAAAEPGACDAHPPRASPRARAARAA